MKINIEPKPTLRGNACYDYLIRAENPIIDGERITGTYIFKIRNNKCVEYGIYNREYPEFEEFKSSNKQRCVSLKNSN